MKGQEVFEDILKLLKHAFLVNCLVYNQSNVKETLCIFYKFFGPVFKLFNAIHTFDTRGLKDRNTANLKF